MTPEEEIAALKAENARQREQIATLLERVRDLEARLAKESHHSSKPPASDGLKRPLPRTRSLRHKTGKKPGGPLGHAGQTLHLVAEPDRVVTHWPTISSAGQAPVDVGAAAVVACERRQVQELPPIRLHLTEHQALSVRCPACQQVTGGAFPAAVPSRAQYGPRRRALAVYLVAQQLVPYAHTRELLADLTGARLWLGTLVAWVQQSAAAAKPVEEALTAALQRAPVLHRAATGVRRNGGLAWAQVASTARLSHSAIHAKRGSEATAAIGIRSGYQGVSVPDGSKPSQAQTTCRQALCTVHHLRELPGVEAHYPPTGAKDLKDLLLKMRTATEQARAQGLTPLPVPQRAALVACSQQLLACGHAANPPPPRRPHHRGRIKPSPARNLLERLWFGQEPVLGISAFLDDLTIPFDTHQAERDRRLLKIQHKVSGGFRSEAGANAFARLRSLLCTWRKQGVALLDALRTLFTDSPLYPAWG